MAHIAQTTSQTTAQIMRELGLRYVGIDELTIRRKRNGTGFIYTNGRGRRLRDERTLYRLKRLAVPPAYIDVVYAPDPSAHLQAVGRDSAGRAQYRYHPNWEQVRELRKAQRLAKLVHLLPRIRTWVTRHLRSTEPNRDLALAAVIELVTVSALRPGSEAYARQHGTRGATTLHKSDVLIGAGIVMLKFPGKGGKRIEKEIKSARLVHALTVLRRLPGKRLFQYRNDDGVVCRLRRRDVNAGLKAMTGRSITLKDFRSLIGSALALEDLAALEPKQSARGRRRQILATMRRVAEELANTPAVCRRSYVHAAVVEAFESGRLRKMAGKHRSLRPAARRERMLANILRAMQG